MCYVQVLGFDFVLYDDVNFVLYNPMVQQGFTMETITWAFDTNTPTGWNPLSWFSHMLDGLLFKDWAGGHHLTSVLLHLANVSLLFELLHRMTASTWRSVVVAGLFAIHPQNVESVAWISERRDVLCMFWILLTLHGYVSYARRSTFGRYALVAGCFAMALLAKPMAVTLPCAMVLLDVWPLGRLKLGDKTAWRRCILEKLPLLAMSGVSSVMTVMTQRGLGAVTDYYHFSLLERICNAMIAYATYLVKLVWPADLAIPYLLPAMFDPWHVVGSFVLLVVVTGFVCRRGRQAPWLWVGWLWYLGTLFPMSGLFQVGIQSHADRFGYLPLIGVLVAIVWWLADYVQRNGVQQKVMVTVAALIFSVLWLMSYVQIGYWRDSHTLFRHTLLVQPDNYVAMINISMVLVDRNGPGDMLEAADLLARGAQLSPESHSNYYNAGQALFKSNQPALAATYLTKSIELKPDFAPGYFLLGKALIDLNQTESAVQYLTRSIELDQSYAAPHYALAVIAQQQGERHVAMKHLAVVVRLDASHAAAHARLQALETQLSGEVSDTR